MSAAPVFWYTVFGRGTPADQEKGESVKKRIVCFMILLSAAAVWNAPLHAASETPAAAVSDDARPLAIFYNFGDNWLGAVTRHYGLNLIAGGLGTWAMIETGLDWELRNAASKSSFLMNTGMPQLIIGQFVPVLTPLTLYLIGNSKGDTKLVSTAAALSQALLITLSIQTPMKMITGRSSLGLMGERDTRTDDFSGEFNWFNLDFMRGWPSGHTANSFAAAAVLAEMYDDKPWLKVGVYSYAIVMGISMAASVHWASDVFAGALIGLAVGKTVGRSFARPNQPPQNISFSFSGTAAAVNFRI